MRIKYRNSIFTDIGAPLKSYFFEVAFFLPFFHLIVLK